MTNNKTQTPWDDWLRGYEHAPVVPPWDDADIRTAPVRYEDLTDEQRAEVDKKVKPSGG